jgi:hypothetical protein
LFRATVSSTVRWQPDKALTVAALGGEDAYTRCCRPTSITTVRVASR